MNERMNVHCFFYTSLPDGKNANEEEVEGYGVVADEEDELVVVTADKGVFAGLVGVVVGVELDVEAGMGLDVFFGIEMELNEDIVVAHTFAFSD
eukprot:m.246474 g.246474  ORF g.246474 m.246474 type:complete len:94 (-) comp70368_c0_seq1:136-417(-)